MDKRLLRFTEYLGEDDKSVPGFVPDDAQILDIMKAQAEQGQRWEKEKKKSLDSLKEPVKTGKVDSTPKKGGDKSEALKIKQFYYFTALKNFEALDDQGKKGILNAIKEWFKTKRKRMTLKIFEKEVKEWKKKLEDQTYPGYSLSVSLVPEDAKIETEPVEKQGETTVKLEDHSVIPPDNQSNLFKNNMWNIEETDKTFNDPAVGEEIKKSLKEDISDDWFNYSDEKKHLIKSIDINSSCNRFRNTGDAEKMSWTELSFKRAGTFAKFILDTAKEVSGSDEYANSIRKLIQLRYLGTNGDGTSGPDPDKNKEGQVVKKGYYLKNGEGFTEKKDKELLKIGVVGVEVKDGQPVLNGKVEMKTAMGLDEKPMTEDPKVYEDYEKYKYIDVSIAFNEGATIKPGGDEPASEIKGDKTKTEGQKLLVAFPYGSKPTGGRPGDGGGTGNKRRRFPPTPKITRKGPVHPCPAF